MTSDIHVYGTDWCGLTFTVRKYLMISRLAYRFHDIDRDRDAEAFVLTVHDGRRRSPVVVVGETVLTQPTIAELQHVLDDQDVRSAPQRTEQAG